MANTNLPSRDPHPSSFAPPLSPLAPRSSPLPTLRTVTLGCKVNQYETEFVRQALTGIGFRDARARRNRRFVHRQHLHSDARRRFKKPADHPATSRPKSRNTDRRDGLLRRAAPKEVSALPGVAEVIADKRELPDLLGRFGVVDLPTGISTFANRQRAYVKVQDGCLLNCSFCIIPKVRPHFSSRPVEDILDEVCRLVNSGYRELILTGIHLGHYGVEWNRGRPKSQWIRLADLVKQIADLPGDFRIRLSSIEATEVTRELIAVMAAFPEKVCPHLHVSLQSGSDAVLRRMRRRWCSKRIIDRCRLFQESLDRPALTTDVIVGFPGETEAEFADTLHVVREIGFSKIHQFPFSPRRGTAAAEMANQVPPAVKTPPIGTAHGVGNRAARRLLCLIARRKLRVLIESPSTANWAKCSARLAGMRRWSYRAMKLKESNLRLFLQAMRLMVEFVQLNNCKCRWSTFSRQPLR